MKKRAVLSVLDDSPALVQTLGSDLSRMGLAVAGHLWSDDMQNHAWSEAARELMHSDTCLWVIAGSRQKFAEKAVRQGLALAALAAQSEHGHNFAILLSPSAGELDVASLPTPLRGAECVLKNIAGKAAVLASKRTGHARAEYRLIPRALPGLGLWFELGPVDTPWKGAFLAASGNSPDVQGVGPAGTIPSNCTLHYPVQGLKLALGEQEFTGNGVHNEIVPGNAYYARLIATPDTIMFGPFPDTDDAELYTVSLC